MGKGGAFEDVIADFSIAHTVPIKMSAIKPRS
jgi:hypothetical protein